MEVCRSCHKERSRMTHTHPFGVPPKKELPVKLDKEGKLTCTSCHEAHASDENRLLRKGGCDACHGGA